MVDVVAVDVVAVDVVVVVIVNVDVLGDLMIMTSLFPDGGPASSSSLK